MQHRQSFFQSCLGQFQIQQRIGIALFVVGSPSVNDKAQVLIEPHCLGILFVDGHFPDAVIPDGVFQQLSAQPLSPYFRQKKQHFQTIPRDAHKGNRLARCRFRSQQVLHAVKCRGNIGLDVFDLFLREKCMRCPDRLFPDCQKRRHKRCGSVLYFTNFHSGFLSQKQKPPRRGDDLCNTVLYFFAFFASCRSSSIRSARQVTARMPIPPPMTHPTTMFRTR